MCKQQSLLHVPGKRARPVSSSQSRRRSALLLASLVSGCTHTLAFSDTTPLVVVGHPPAPKVPQTKPPEPPAKPPDPPAPKRVEVQRDQIVIHDKIQFETDKATIRPESGSLLAEITAVIQQNPQIRRLSIEGHTDSTGSDRHNQGLSEQRAAAVRGYLVEHGVAADRLTSRGWGESRPLSDNGSAAGRELNRRVEFVILEQDIPAPTEQAPAAGAQAPTAPVEGDKR